MKVTFTVNNGANIHSAKSVTFDLNRERDVRAFGFTKEEWTALTEEEKQETVNDWAYNYLEIYYEEEE